MKNKLSHSSVSTYQTCAHKYYLHYVEKLRDTHTHAALLFGSAIDTTLNRVLEDLQRGPNEYDFTFHTYKNVFTVNWRQGFINKKKVDLYNNETLVYAKTDFDAELLTPEDINTLSSFLHNNAIGCVPDKVLAFYAEMQEKKENEGFDNLPLVIKQFMNYANWLCMFHKGMLMLEAYQTEIMPKIKKVLCVQKEISLESDDESGDKITGFVDAVLEWEDGSVVIFDHKTSAREYEQDSVLKSPQLTLYMAALRDEYKATKAGYIVFRKMINKQRIKTCTVCSHEAKSRAKTCDNEIKGKRCGGEWIEKINPKCNMQVIIGNIPKRVEQIVLENFADINAQIKTGVFPRNLSACENPFPCQFRKLCWENKKDNLIKVDDK